MKNHEYTHTANGITIILQKLQYKPKPSTVNDKSCVSIIFRKTFVIHHKSAETTTFLLLTFVI